MFKLIKKNSSSQARLGELKTKHGVIKTPFFMPIATKGAVKYLDVEDIEKLGAQIILSNTFHLLLKPGMDLMKKAKGLHKFMNWPKPILTDSGGYQVYSLARLRRIDHKGVSFQSPIDGKEYYLDPEKVLEIQSTIGSDIAMILDECPAYPCTKKEAELAVKRTYDWAKRSIKWRQKNPKKLEHVFAIVQGSVHRDLREQSALGLVELPFDGYAIGGLAVGEPRQNMFEVLGYTIPLLPQDKPRYLMGVGYPEEIVRAVKLGIDMFDCVIPTREGRHSRVFIWQKDPSKINLLKTRAKFYSMINITNQKFANDFSQLDKNCNCLTCRNYTKAYIRHLFSVGEPLAQRLITIHNLHFYMQMMEKIRKEIK